MEGHGSIINMDKFVTILHEERMHIRIFSFKEVKSMLKTTIDILVLKKTLQLISDRKNIHNRSLNSADNFYKISLNAEI